MNPQVLYALLKLKKWNQSDLARRLQVSRQCVSLWLSEASRNASINMESKNLEALSLCLGVSVNDLLKPLPCTEDQSTYQLESTRLNWDNLYPDLISLAIGAARGELIALARIVQTYGLFTSATFLGKDVWKRFPKYKKYIKPVLRPRLENVWNFANHLKTT